MTWRATTALGTATYGLQVVQAGGYVYAIGGNTGAFVGTVNRSTMASDGTLGSWSADSALPASRGFGRALVVRRESDAKDYLVFTGGSDGTVRSSVYYTTQTTSGALNAWSTSGTSLLAARAHHGFAAIGEYLFVFGGSDNAGAGLSSVEWNTLGGVISGTAWQSLTALPAARGRTHGARDGRVLYLTGGVDTSAGSAFTTCYRGLVTFLNGTPTVSWASTTALPVTLSRHSSLVYDHHLYVQGGSRDATAAGNTDNSDIYRAPLLADGGLGDWQKVSTLASGFPNYRPAIMLGTPADGMVVAGGQNSAGTLAADAWRETPLTFWRQAERSDGTGLILKLHVYLDGVLTYRYASEWFDDGTTHETILKSISPIHRGLGADRFPMAADVDVELDNTTGAADWLVNQATAGDWLKATVRLYVGTFEPTATEYPAGAFAWFPLGEYYLTEPPERDSTSVRFGMTEDTRGVLVDMLRPPTLRDWRNAGGSPWNIVGVSSQLPSEVEDKALPLAFGPEYVEGEFLHLARNGINTGEFSFAPICATRNPATSIMGALNPTELIPIALYVGTDDPSVPWALVPHYAGNNLVRYNLLRSDAITKDGVTWYVQFIRLANHVMDYLGTVWRTWKDVTLPDGTALFSGNDVRATAVRKFAVLLSPGSSTETANSRAKVSPESVLRDLVGMYSRAGHGYVDEDACERFEFALHRTARCAGTLAIGDGTSVRNAVADVLGSWDFDAFADWRGRLSVTGHIKDYGSQTSDLTGLYELAEEDIWDVSDRQPGPGERWAVFNRVYVEDIKDRSPGVKPPYGAGPWDNPNTILGTTRFREVRLSAAWRASREQDNPWNRRHLDPTPRPVISFSTHLGILKLDLGAYFLLSWTRNLGSPYTSDLFKLDEVTVDAPSGTARVKAVWVAETSDPFLIDERTYVLRSDDTGGVTVTINDSSATATFSAAGKLTNVVNGDQLILKDRSEAGTGTKRRRALLLTATPTSTTVTMSDPSLDFGTGGAPTAVASWEIRRSHLTAPALAFPDYPDGSALYGKISSGSPAQYSDATAAHYLPD